MDLIPNLDEHELRRIVREVPLDPGLSALAQSLRTAGAEIVVLSDGCGFYAEEVCEGRRALRSGVKRPASNVTHSGPLPTS